MHCREKGQRKIIILAQAERKAYVSQNRLFKLWYVKSTYATHHIWGTATADDHIRFHFCQTRKGVLRYLRLGYWSWAWVTICFVLVLIIPSAQVSSGFCGFPLVSQKHANRWTGYAKIVPRWQVGNGLPYHPGCCLKGVSKDRLCIHHNPDQDTAVTKWRGPLLMLWIRDINTMQYML